MSRAMYVDEGFYSDAAQNFVKFGSWGLPYDLRHWPGAPMLTVLQTSVFSVFGISTTAARLISVGFGLVSFVSLYLIARVRFGDLLSLFFSVVAISTISFTSHSRAAIADPIALGFSMLALLFFLRIDNRLWAIPLSLLAAYFAFLSKMYFLFTLLTLVMFWLIEIVIMSRVNKNRVKSELCVFLASLLLITLSYLLVRIVFKNSFAEFLHINSNKIPVFDLIILGKQFLISLQHIPFNTKTHILLFCLILVISLSILSKIFRKDIEGIIHFAHNWGREGWVFTVFLFSGIGIITALNIPTKAHYFYFSILPISFLAVLGLVIILPDKLKTPVISGILLVQLLFQATFYSEWLNRSELNSVADASNSIVSQIENENPILNETVAIIGQYASQLGLYSHRLMPLDLRWSKKTQVCNRIDYWKPKYLVDFHFPARGSFSYDTLIDCPQINNLELISRFSVFKQWQDEIVFSRIIYNQ